MLVMQGYIKMLQEERICCVIEGKDKFEGATIVDALSASGLRTIRYIK